MSSFKSDTENRLTTPGLHVDPYNSGLKQLSTFPTDLLDFEKNIY